MTVTTEYLVAVVRGVAQRDYNTGGWDVIVECWTDEMIADQIKGAQTAMGALRKMSPVISVYRDRYADAINSAF